ncbi:phospholipase B-like protein (macronuclear) [Tetrahymena thermophila SB210]|uniref:Phospholipase B-like n=1 Tax=Tetrahymena thermophila (strain SB210) TaxID=312017 RepID=Q22T06_TETTS|nr:phospholipase B-like protein [Tetrahymena thermophila SB210]EAR88632.2 phospholipase B-like protein [Tetrahymena thermophila SB210]|eukprot:XP_001008877.2 phospholipase B-like protein [Tetrahymena thermophila SB210]
MNLKQIFFIVFIISLASCQVKQLEDESIQFDTQNLNLNYLQSSTIKLVAIKKGDSFLVQQNDDNKYSVNKKEVCASIEYQKTLNETGWDVIFLDTNQSFSPEEQMQCAGFLEGLASKQAIADFLFNISSQRGSTKEQYKAFFTNVYNNLLSKANNPPKNTEQYWNTAKLFLIQLVGLKNGYNALENNEDSKLELWQISLPNIDGQADEIDQLIASGSQELGVNQQQILVHQKAKLRRHINHKRKNSLFEWEQNAMHSRCSAFFKILTAEQANGAKILKDIFASHSTWEPFSSMNRIYKFYRLPSLISTHSWVQMSSYPGAITSTDDFIVKEGKFLVTETSISSQNRDTVSSLRAIDVDIPDFIRVQTATSLSQSGMQWAEYMSKYGAVKMYSSEWMILDYSKLQKGKEIPNNSFIVLSSSYEQQIIEDKTQELIDNTYFASFNNPHNKIIRDYLGYTQVEQYNDLFSLKQDPRNLIFKHFQAKAQSIEKVKWLMLHNSYKKKPLEGEPTFQSSVAALGARGDIEGGSNFGEVDVKVVNIDLLKNFSVEAISGPSHQEQPVFIWKQNDNDRHQGQPTAWNFDWGTMSLSMKSSQ